MILTKDLKKQANGEWRKYLDLEASGHALQGLLS